MANSRRIHVTFIGVSVLVAGIAGPLALFELTQPGHGVNPYYLALHPSIDELVQLDSQRAPAVPGETASALNAAPTMVMPTGLIVARRPR